MNTSDLVQRVAELEAQTDAARQAFRMADAQTEAARVSVESLRAIVDDPARTNREAAGALLAARRDAARALEAREAARQRVRSGSAELRDARETLAARMHGHAELAAAVRSAEPAALDVVASILERLAHADDQLRDRIRAGETPTYRPWVIPPPEPMRRPATPEQQQEGATE